MSRHVRVHRRQIKHTHTRNAGRRVQAINLCKSTSKQSCTQRIPPLACDCFSSSLASEVTSSSSIPNSKHNSSNSSCVYTFPRASNRSSLLTPSVGMMQQQASRTADQAPLERYVTTECAAHRRRIRDDLGQSFFLTATATGEKAEVREEIDARCETKVNMDKHDRRAYVTPQSPSMGGGCRDTCKSEVPFHKAPSLLPSREQYCCVA